MKHNPLDFSRGKIHGTYYITVSGKTVALNFESHASATRWANANISPYPYKIWKVESK